MNGIFYLNLGMVVVKHSEPEKLDIELSKLADKAKKERMEKLEPYFGILKDKNIDPLKLQKKWRSDW